MQHDRCREGQPRQRAFAHAVGEVPVLARQPILARRRLVAGDPDHLERPEQRKYVIDACIIVSGKNLKSMATIKLNYKKQEEVENTIFEETGQGDGGYDAFMNAIKKIASKLDISLPELIDYQVAIPPGGKTDALVQCSITWRNHKTFVTKGVHSDQVFAAVEATEKMLNLII